jgi:hypothetical protein
MIKILFYIKHKSIYITVKNYCYFILALLLCSCNVSDRYRNAETFTLQDIPETVSLTGEPVEFDSIVMNPGYITLVDSVLILTNRNTDRLIHCFDVRNRKKVTESIMHGNGPEDMLDARYAQIVDTCVWIFDMQLRMLRQYGKHDICFSHNPKSLNRVRLEGLFSAILALPGQDKFIASTVQPNKKRFALYDTDGNILNEFGVFPESNASMTPVEAIQSFVGHSTCSDDKFIFACNRTDLIELYNFDGSLYKQLHGPDGFFPHLKQREVEGGGIAVSGTIGKSREGYFSPVAYGNELWVMYDGRYEVTDPNHLINTIIVFNLDKGKPVRLIHLDKAISKFAIDGKNKALYGISSDPEYHIVRFDLSGIK